MKADSFAKLVVLEALLEAEIGYWLESPSSSTEQFREGLVSRISDLIDEIDTLDSVAAARVYDAVVDFLAELPDDPDGVVEASLRFQRAIDRIVERGIDRRDLAAASTWAIVLEELLSDLADEYHLAIAPDGEVRPREYARSLALLARARQAADRMLWSAEAVRPEMIAELSRLTYAVRNRRLRPPVVDHTIRAIQRRSAKYRPSTLTRIGAFVLRQVMGRDPSVKAGEPRRSRRKPLEALEPRRAT
jgi:hypothetical protein